MTEPASSARLKTEARALQSALAEFEHEERRLRDALERRGGRGFALEAQLEQVRKNIAVTRRDLERVRAAIGGDR